ncbi:MAG: mechanosensitive ion channel [Gammaproteobacteria bacterium]|nr:mechanosensitive ion channel [Gammaproteobacteria bacterium]MDH3856752.1 mechanosensitive ion channel [Gammaproteobacteria bacterium]
MENITTWISENAFDWGIKIGIAIAIFIVGKIVARILSNLVKKAMSRAGTDAILVGFIGNITYAILLIAVVLAAIDSLGVNVTSLMAIVAAAGLAVGLALKDSLGNFAAGVMIIIFRPFKIGDFITAGGAAGVVDEIGLFATMMHTGDNQRLIVPNSSIIGGNIVNTSALPTRRIDLVFGIGYDDNIGQARDIIMAVMEADERILKDPAPAVAVGELADSSVNLNVRPWVESGDYWPVRADLLEGIKVKFDEAGISIPYPQQDVYMHEVNAAS